MKTDYKSEIRQAIEAGQAKTIERLVVDLVREKINDYRKPDDGSYSHIAHYTSLDNLYAMFTDDGNSQSNDSQDPSINKEEQSDDRSTCPPKKTRECGLRLYDIDSLNDPTEGMMAIIRLRERLGIGIEGPRSGAYVCSFVSGGEDVRDELQYWMHYGARGLGCSIMLPMAYVQNPEEGFASFAMYDGEKLSKDCLEEIAIIYAELGNEEHRNIFLANALGAVRCLFKHRAYRYEREYRHVAMEGSYPKQWEKVGLSIRKFRYESSLHIRNVMSSSSTITIGPSVPEPEKVKQGLEEIAQALGLVGITFERSGIPHR